MLGEQVETVTGRLEVTGSEPAASVTLRSEGRWYYELTGSLLAELRNLAGTTVRVSGQRGQGSPAAQFDVSAYEVLLVDGDRPLVGVIGARGEETWLAGPDSVTLLGAPAALTAGVGAKVWIVGRRDGAGLRVLRFGVIRGPRQ